ncbi:DNA repair protein RecN [Sphingorhabdus lutea]|uniref:DNA repair protein RecN n=1 Tax=Sphingorhabdus lutea TaxID=1913578 RepID=A0A1L3JCQ2_9SPHN|nr:DNA repair protein RecN [Sphingorhabdus lutea]APG62900.1 DNA repair protein RecN [Sphingorhabdus lutea]
MLNSLSIRNIVLIEALDLDFRAGLSVLTGETGAGKSILLDSLGLVLGMRADSGLVRQGADKAQVIAVFEPEIMKYIAHILDEQDMEWESGEQLIIRRTLRADGGSKAFINDQSCSASLLREIGNYLVEIHGQHDDRGLLNAKGHRDLLDNFSDVNLSKLHALFRKWHADQSALNDAKSMLEKAAEEREFLEHAISELQNFAPKMGEEEELANARADMQKGERIAEDLSSILVAFEGSDCAMAQLRGAARRLDRVAEQHDLLACALAAIDRALIEAGEAEEHLARAAEAMSFDPEMLNQYEERLFALRALARKYQVQGDELGPYLQGLQAKLSSLEAGEAGLAQYEQAVIQSRSAYEAEAKIISEKRQKGAAKLDRAVAAELIPLKLDAAKFQCAISTQPIDKWNEQGMDYVEFLISTNPGAPFAPLAKIASGGELSRFILALKVALAEEGGAQTIIFDEIDRGVGGAVASAIGERLARLANGAAKKDGVQLLAVTHSPQVASKGNQHFFIAKSSQGTVTRTSVSQLSSDERKEEIARMLSGAEVTDEARAQAQRLLESAA